MTKASQPDLTRGEVRHEVRWLDVPVDEPSLVQTAQRHGQTDADPQEGRDVQ